MNPGSPLTTVIEQVYADANRKRDFIVPASMMTMTPDNDKLSFGDNDYRLTPHSMGQLYDYAGIPRKFAEFLKTQEPNLININVNHLLASRDGDRRMVRTYSKDSDTHSARAFVSDRFAQGYDYIDVARELLPKAFDMGFQAESCQITESKLFFNLVSPKLEGELRIKEPVRGGIQISVSEIGLGKINILPWLEILSCLNGATFKEFGKGRTHIGIRLDTADDGSFEVFSTETIMKTASAWWSQARDYMNLMGSEDGFSRLLNALRERQGDPIQAGPVQVIEAVAKQFNMVEEEKNNLLFAYIKAADTTRFGLSQAVTSLSHEMPDYDRAMEFNEIGGKILTLEGPRWKELAEV